MILHWLKPWAIAHSRSKTRRRKIRWESLLVSEIQTLEPRLMLTDYLVTTTADVPNDPGLISPDGQISLREAILAASLNVQVGDAPAGELGGAGGVIDTITFDSSILGQTILLTQGVLSITDDLDINGFGSPANMTIDAQGESRIFSITGTIAVTLSHLTLTGGVTASGNGGAIFNQDAGLALFDLTLTGNSANFGGGISNESGIVTIESSTIGENTAGVHGGGIYNEGSGSVTITGSSLTGNLATGDGGGIYNDDGTVIVESSCSISENVAGFGVSDGGGSGGGIANQGILEISDGNIFNNSANNGNGGGILNRGSLSLTGGMILGNTAGESGGGIANLGTPGTTTDIIMPDEIAFATVNNSTFAMNASMFGGGISNSLGVINITNSTLSENFVEEEGGAISNRGTLSLANSTVSGNSANGNGGGLRNASGSSSHPSEITVVNSTIVLNRADADGEVGGTGGGIWTAMDSETFTTLFNTLVAGNEQDSTTFQIPSDLANKNLEDNSTFNLIGDPNSAGGLMEGASGNRVGDGMGNLLPVEEIIETSLADNGGLTLTHLPLFSGRAIDAGSNASAIDPGPDAVLGTSDDVVLMADQRGDGFPRVIDVPSVPNADGGIDIGAVELDEFPTQFFEIVVLDADRPEGDAGPTVFTFEVTRSGDTSGSASVDFSFFGSDVNALDFVGGMLPSGTVNFESEETEETITIEVQGDFVVERDEVFSVELSNPITGGFITESTAMGTIRNDDSATITIGNVMLPEGNSGTTDFVFTVTLSHQVDADVTLNAQTILGGSADPLADYTPLMTTPITFSANSMAGATRTVTVSVSGDQDIEPDETFFVELDTLEAGGLDVRFEGGDANLTATGTILNDDAEVTISIGDAAAIEDQGTLEFTVTISAPITKTVSVELETQGLSATEGVDFASLDGLVVTFAPGGPLTQTISVTILDDTEFEATEALRVLLSNPLIDGMSDPSRFAIEDGEGIGAIINNEAIRIAGAGSGQRLESMPPQVIVQNAATGEILHNFLAYNAGFLGGVRVAAGDVNGDGAADVITAAGPGGGPHVKVFDGLSGQLLSEFFAFDSRFLGGVFVAAGDVTGDGRADILTGAGAGGGPHVRVFDGQTLQLLQDFFAFDPRFTGGVRVATGDFNGDARSDLITAAGPGGGPHVRVLDGQTRLELANFFAYGSDFRGGVFVAAGDVDGDGFADVITGAGAGGGPHVRVFDGLNLPQLQSEFFAFDPNMSLGIAVGTTDINGDAIAEILVGTGPGSPAQFRIFDSGGTLLDGGRVFNPHFRSGVFVGGSLAPSMLPTLFPVPILSSSPVPGLGDAESLPNNGPLEPLENELMGQLLEDGIFGQLLLDALDA